MTETINLYFLHDNIFLFYVYWISLNTKPWLKVQDGHRVELSAHDHPVHQLPLSGEGVEL